MSHWEWGGNCLKKEKSWKKIILSGIVVFFVCFAGNILGKLLTPDSQEVLMYLLTKPENISLNTTEEKTNNCSYQILNGILYMNKEEGFCQYDFVEKEWKTLWSGEVYDYQIAEENVYCMEFKDDAVSSNEWNIISRDLNHSNKKKVLIEEVFDCVFYEKRIYYSRIYEDKRCIWEYDINTLRSREIFSIDLQAYEEIEYVNLVTVSERYFVFAGELGVWIYNRETCQWNCLKVDFEDINLYSILQDIQADKNYLYFQVWVCDSTKSAIAGPYIEEGSDENGIWRINLKTGQREQLSNKIYYGGIYILDGVLYAIDDGKYEAVKQVN